MTNENSPVAADTAGAGVGRTSCGNRSTARADANRVAPEAHQRALELLGRPSTRMGRARNFLFAWCGLLSGASTP